MKLLLVPVLAAALLLGAVSSAAATVPPVDPRPAPAKIKIPSPVIAHTESRFTPMDPNDSDPNVAGHTTFQATYVTNRHVSDYLVTIYIKTLTHTKPWNWQVLQTYVQHVAVPAKRTPQSWSTSIDMRRLYAWEHIYLIKIEPLSSKYTSVPATAFVTVNAARQQTNWTCAFFGTAAQALTGPIPDVIGLLPGAGKVATLAGRFTKAQLSVLSAVNDAAPTVLAVGGDYAQGGKVNESRVAEDWAKYMAKRAEGAADAAKYLPKHLAKPANATRAVMDKLVARPIGRGLYVLDVWTVVQDIRQWGATVQGVLDQCSYVG